MPDYQPPRKRELLNTSGQPIEQTEDFIDAAYQDRVHRFRANVIELFERHQAETMGDTWIAFDTTFTNKARKAARNGGFLYGAERITAIHTEIVEPKELSGRQAKLSIRFLTNECFSNDGSVDHLTTDTIIDRVGDAQHYMELSRLDDDYDPEAEQPFCIPIISANENGIGMVGQLSEFTPYDALTNFVDGQIEFIAPLGNFDNRQDRDYAIQYAEELLDELQGIVPIVRYYPDNS